LISSKIIIKIDFIFYQAVSTQQQPTKQTNNLLFSPLLSIQKVIDPRLSVQEVSTNHEQSL